MRAPKFSETTQKFLQENSARIAVLQVKQDAAITGIAVDEYNALAQTLLDDAAKAGAQGGAMLAFVKDGQCVCRL